MSNWLWGCIEYACDELFSRKHSIRMEHVEFRVCEYEKNRLGVCVKHHLPEVRSALAKRKLRENRLAYD